jgi:hypothetical protein
MRDAKKEFQVKALQAFLNEQYGSGIVNGYFGVQTKKSVIRFQKEMRIPATGVVGPQTIAHIRMKCGDASSAGTPKPLTPPATCKVWYDGCNVCSRETAQSDFRCTMRACPEPHTGQPSCTASFTQVFSTPPVSATEPVCSKKAEPVCGTPASCLTTNLVESLPQECTQGKTYVNRCTLDAEKAIFLHDGKCS